MTKLFERDQTRRELNKVQSIVDPDTGLITLREVTAPAAPAADEVVLYCRDASGTSRVYYKRSDNTEVELGAAPTVSLSGTVADRPAAGVAERLYLPSNGVSVDRDTGAAWASWGPLFALTPPILADYDWVNQGAATADSTNGGLYLSVPAAVGNSLRILKKAAPARPYTVTLCLALATPPGYAAEAGFLWRQADGKIVAFGFKSNGSGLWTMRVAKFTNETTYSAPYVDASWSPSLPVWLQVTEEAGAGNRICRYSCDGQHWHQAHTIGRTDFVTATEIGMYCYISTASFTAGAMFYSWVQS